MAWDIIFDLIGAMSHIGAESRRRHRIRRSARVAWENAARSFGAELEDAPQNGEWQRFVVDVEKVHITVDHLGNVDGETRIGAKAAAPTHERLKIYSASRFSPIARMVGFQDVLLGDAAFDEAFVIKANDPVFARTWVNAVVRGRIARVPDYRFELKGGRVTATGKGLETSAKGLRSAIRAIAAFADGRQRIMQSWGKLTKRYDAKLERRKSRWAVLRGRHEGVSFRIDTHEHADSHFTVVVARAPKTLLEPFVLAHERQAVSTCMPLAVQVATPDHYRLFSEAPHRAIALFNEDRRGLLGELSITKIEAEPQRVKVFVPGLCVNRKTLTQVVSLATELAQSGEMAPYR